MEVAGRWAEQEAVPRLFRGRSPCRAAACEGMSVGAPRERAPDPSPRASAPVLSGEPNVPVREASPSGARLRCSRSDRPGSSHATSDEKRGLTAPSPVQGAGPRSLATPALDTPRQNELVSPTLVER